MSGATVLVVDDEFIRDLTSSALRIAGFATTMASGGLDALAAIERDHPDIVVLDVGLPGVDGFEVCRRLRAAGDQTPVMFLTARDAAEDRVSGFTRGGDDYLAKPFSIGELVARVRAILRRSRAPATSSRLRHADLEIDEDTLRVTRGGQPVQLSPTELKVLRFLLLNRERVLSKAQILDHVWSYDFGGNAGMVENYVSYATVADGRVDQATADERKETLPERAADLVNGDLDRDLRRHPARPVALRTIADTIGISADRLRGARRDGQTIAQVAEANGTDPQDVIDELTARATQRITKVVNGDTVRQRC
jgi:two-component system OmpR family response regulator